MTKRTLTVILASLALIVSACGDDADPSTANNGGANNTATNNTGGNNTGGNNTGGNNTGGNNTTTNNTGGNNTTTNNTGGNNTTTNNNGGNNTGGPCTVDTSFFGQISTQGSGDHDGGVPSTDALTVDAGLDDVLAAIPAVEDDEATADVNESIVELDTAIPVRGAIVTATSFGDQGNVRFWLADANGAIQTFLAPGTDLGTTIKVGDALDFDVTSVQNYGGSVPQILTIENFSVVSSGNAVPYLEATGQALTIDDYAKVVRIGGELATSGTGCGGSSTCYEMTHGGQTITFRTASNFIEGGECITFVGPLSAFPGPNTASPTTHTIQLDTINYDWSWTVE